MKELVVIIGTTLLGCYIFSLMIGEAGTLEYSLGELIKRAAGVE